MSENAHLSLLYDRKVTHQPHPNYAFRTGGLSTFLESLFKATNSISFNALHLKRLQALDKEAKP